MYRLYQCTAFFKSMKDMAVKCILEVRFFIRLDPVVEIKKLAINSEWRRKGKVFLMKCKTYFKRFLFDPFPPKSVVADVDKCQSGGQFWELPDFVVTKDKFSKSRQLSECVFVNLRY